MESRSSDQLDFFCPGCVKMLESIEPKLESIMLSSIGHLEITLMLGGQKKVIRTRQLDTVFRNYSKIYAQLAPTSFYFSEAPPCVPSSVTIKF